VTPRGVDRLSLLAGIVFVLAGIGFLLDALDVWDLRDDYLVPIGLIVVGVVVLGSAWPTGRRSTPNRRAAH
jgi:hypothetical protein